MCSSITIRYLVLQIEDPSIKIPNSVFTEQNEMSEQKVSSYFYFTLFLSLEIRLELELGAKNQNNCTSLFCLSSLQRLNKTINVEML